MIRLAMAIAVATFLASFTDWLFMGVLWHEHYLAFPEVWRRQQGGDMAGENKAVMWACLLNVLTCGVFLALCAHFGLHLTGALKLAVAVWIALPLPLLVGNHLFIKLHPKITTAHCLGWLAKLVVAAACVAIL